MIGAIRHALRKLHEAEEDGKALTNVEAYKMMNFVALALRKATLSAAAKKKEIKEVRIDYRIDYSIIQDIMVI